MKKKIILFIMLTLIMTTASVVNVSASDSASTDGVNHTVHGSITDKMFTGRVSGTIPYATATIKNAHYYNNNGKSVRATDRAGSPYVNYGMANFKDGWKWNNGYVEGKTPNTNAIRTRNLIN